MRTGGKERPSATRKHHPIQILDKKKERPAAKGAVLCLIRSGKSRSDPSRRERKTGLERYGMVWYESE